MNVLGISSSSAGSGTGTGTSYITDAGLISTITDSSNWDGSGEYTGSTTGLSAGNVYIDTANKLRYEFDGTTLTRSQINNVL